MDENIYCSICKRGTPEKRYVEKHHLIPASRGGKHGKTILVCVDCGDQLHKLFTLKELKDEYNSLDAILSSEKVQTWIKWIRKQKRFKVCMIRKKRKK